MTALNTEKREGSFFQGIYDRLLFLFTTNKGLIALLILFEFGIVLFLSSFSEPVVEVFGNPILDPIWKIDLDESDRAARIIMLYHAMAVPFITAVVLFVLEFCEVRESYVSRIKWALIPGTFLTAISGIIFAYILDDWTAHGLFIFGLSLSFYGGVLLLLGTFPTKNFPEFADKEGRPLLWGIDLEQLNLMLVIACLLTSTIIGGWAAAYFGRGLEAFLAEDVVREESHNIYERAIVSHLHIMVALLAAAVMIVVFRYSEMKGRWYFIAMLLTTPGMLIMSVGAWLVIPEQTHDFAHRIINVGAGFLLAAALILALHGWSKTSKEILGEDYDAASWTQRAIAALKDPVKFGMYFQFVWVNLVVTIPGIYVAINLDTYRSDGYEEVERAFNTGHWHVLATLTAIVVLFLAIDCFSIKGNFRQAIGWLLLAGSIIGFGFTVFYMLRDPDMDKMLSFYLIDAGVALIFAGVAILCLALLLKFIWERPADRST
ncbi:MAG: hypothetical protein ACXACI_02680 [Candidatus Hodarchaeales archaeon]|jgi:hypothetical protein